MDLRSIAGRQPPLAWLCWIAVGCCIAFFTSVSSAAAYDGQISAVVISPNPVQTGRTFTVTITAASTDETASSVGIEWDVNGNYGLESVDCPGGWTSVVGEPDCRGTLVGTQTLTMTVYMEVDEPGTYTYTATIYPADATPADDALTGSFTAVGATPTDNEGGGTRGGTGENTSGSTPGATPPTLSAPRITRLGILPTRFRAASRGATFAQLLASRSTLPLAAETTATGAWLTYALDQNATARFRVLRATSGRSVGGRCVPRLPANQRRRKCTLYLALPGSVAINALKGTHRVRFSGRWRGRKLPRGAYQLALAATNSKGKTSATKRIVFHIV